MAAVFESLADLLGAAPLDLGATRWRSVEAGELADFAAATGQVSPYLSVALTNRFLPELIEVPAAASGVNYGAESIELGPVLQSGQRVRARAVLVSATEVRGGAQTLVEITLEVEGSPEPACVVRSLSRWLA